jgi:pyruvate formate lyase activating enzyme
MTSEEVVDCVLRDRKFYERSGGGVTVSGGEPTFQYEFLLGLLSAFKKEGLHTVQETNGLLSWDKLEHLTKLVDIFYFDLKGIDPVLHKEQTGVSNDLILTNAKWLIGKFNVVFRLPLIPTLNTTPELIKRLDDFLSEINATEIHLLPYHRLGEEKLESIHTHQQPLSISEMTLIEAERLKQILQKPSRRVFIGGF